MQTARIRETAACHTKGMENKKLKENKTLNKNYYAFHDCNVRLHGKTQKLEETKTKQIYWHFVDRTSLRPTSEKKWNEK